MSPTVARCAASPDPTTISRAIKVNYVAKCLERVADHATNVAEMVIFMIKGKDIRHTVA